MYKYDGFQFKKSSSSGNRTAKAGKKIENIKSEKIIGFFLCNELIKFYWKRL